MYLKVTYGDFFFFFFTATGAVGYCVYWSVLVLFVSSCTCMNADGAIHILVYAHTIPQNNSKKLRQEM